MTKTLKQKRRCKRRGEWYRCGSFDNHHLKPSSRGGQDIPSNLLQMDLYRHDAWHLLFNNRTLDEVIDLLQRLKQIKSNLEVDIKL